MSTTKEATTAEPKFDTETGERIQPEQTYDPETGYPEGLDTGESYTDKSPEEKSEPIPLPYASRLVGKTEEEVQVLLAEEHVAAAQVAVEEQKDNPTTPEAELTAAQKELAEAEKAKAAKEKETEASTPKPTPASKAS